MRFKKTAGGTVAHDSLEGYCVSTLEGSGDLIFPTKAHHQAFAACVTGGAPVGRGQAQEAQTGFTFVSTPNSGALLQTLL